MEKKRIIKSAPGRIALVGNPFDIYGGQTIALTLKDLRSYVCVERNGLDHQEISSEIYRPGNNRSSQRNELEHAVIEELDLQYNYFKLFDVSDMPYETGFARSTAAVVAMIRAFNDAFELGIKDHEDVSELAWRIERKLGVCGGQERYAIAHDDDERDPRILEQRIEDEGERVIGDVGCSRPGKLFYMNFAGREAHRFDSRNYSIIDELDVPDMKIGAAYSGKKKKSSFDVHKRLRELYLNEEKAKEIIEKYRDMSVLTTQKALGEFKRKNPNLSVVGKCMTESLDIRFGMFKELSKRNMLGKDAVCAETVKMRNIAEDHGAYGVNQPGSKSIIFLYEDDMINKVLEDIGYHVIKIQK